MFETRSQALQHRDLIYCEVCYHRHAQTLAAVESVSGRYSADEQCQTLVTAARASPLSISFPRRAQYYGGIGAPPQRQLLQQHTRNAVSANGLLTSASRSVGSGSHLPISSPAPNRRRETRV